MSEVIITIDVRIDDNPQESQDDRQAVMEAVSSGNFEVIKIQQA